MRIIAICSFAAIGVLTCGAYTAKNAAGSPPANRQSMEVVLIARTPKARLGGDITLWLAVRNLGQKAVRLDGRMAWPGNVFLWVKAPGSSEEFAAELVRPGLPWPTEGDLVAIRPGCFYGLQLVVGPSTDAVLVDQLKRLRPGRYTFRAVFSSPTVPKLRIQGFEESSNNVTVLVE